MQAKLTLTIEQSIINQAKSYAKLKGRSLSELIESYLEIITKNSQKDKIELSASIKKLKGSIKLPVAFDYKKELSKSLYNKYNK